MRKYRIGCRAFFVLVAVASMATTACSKKDLNQEAVASVNGEIIRVIDIREYLGVPGGIVALEGVPTDQKMQAVDQVIAGRLLVQEGRALGLDNSDEYRSTVQQNETGVRINALLRKIAIKSLAVDDKAIQAEIGKIREKDAKIPDAEAKGQATRILIDRQIRAIRKNLVSTAKKETGAAIDNAMVAKVGTSGGPGDDAVLASAGEEKILYSEVKKIIQEIPQLPIRQGQQSAEMMRGLVDRVLEQELTLRALIAYSRKEGIDGSDWYRSSERTMERVVIANMMFEKIVAQNPQVTDREVAEEYAKRAKMMEGQGQKAPPLEAVKEQVRGIIQEEKRRETFETYLNDLRKKAHVSVNNDILSGV